MDIVSPDRQSGECPQLLPQHIADLTASGISPAQIEACGFYSESDPSRVRDQLGGWMSRTTAAKLGPCLVIPYLGPDGRPMTYTDGDGNSRLFVRLKPDKPRTDKKDKGKKIKYESPLGTPCRAYFPPATRAALSDPAVPLILTEGEKKAASADQHGIPCVGLGGVWAWQLKRDEDDNGEKTGARELIPDLVAVAWQGRRVTVVYDSDLAGKPEVQWARWHFSQVLRERGAEVRVADIPAEENGAKAGLDDYLVAHGREALRKLLDEARSPERPVKGDGRPEIVISTEEHEVNMHAVAALAKLTDLYQRGRVLSRVIYTEEEPESEAVVRRQPGSPVIRDLPPPLLREWMTQCARWVQIRKTKEGEEKIPAHPPDWSVSAIHARGHWPRVRRLEAVVDHPIVLADGSVLAANGYDRRSRLLVSVPDGLNLSTPDAPNKGHAAAAVEAINDAIRDFPFEREEHRAAWFAGLLTPLAWFAFEGPAPLTLIDGNVRGVGKGLLADVIAIILTGRRFSVMSYTPEREELRKRITAVAMEGERLVLLDNLAGAVGNDVLDAALTTDRWKDRVLGMNRVYDGPLHVAWFATGNNVELRADTARRCSHCRLETPEERPEFKSGFKYPDLRKHLRENRGPLLSAALTILRAWYAAGRPTHGLKPWGSFEGWSSVIREALVFAGLPDPGETRLALQTTADRDAVTMLTMIDALERADTSRKGMTTAEIIDAVRNPQVPAPEWHADLKSAVEELAGRLDGRTLAYRFRHFARRNFGGKMIDRGSSVSANNTTRWVVCSAELSARPGTSPVSPASPDHTTDRPAGDAGDTGDRPAQPGNPEVNGKPHPPSRNRFGNNDTPHERREQ